VGGPPPPPPPLPPPVEGAGHEGVGGLVGVFGFPQMSPYRSTGTRAAHRTDRCIRDFIWKGLAVVENGKKKDGCHGFSQRNTGIDGSCCDSRVGTQN
jgi:hypothetical protein